MASTFWTDPDTGLVLSPGSFVTFSDGCSDEPHLIEDDLQAGDRVACPACEDTHEVDQVISTPIAHNIVLREAEPEAEPGD
ncbi:hypothetical protein [Pseudonocardia sp. NPDC049635]|uniref:hypothetical protein n=1 Tax=Pseudonocardia sp. NPDC049635 TaxID=3155506 RepID=UPI0033F45532